MKITINTSLTAPTIPEVEKSQTMAFYGQGLPGLANAYMMVPEMNDLKPKSEAIKEMADIFNIDTLQSTQQATREAKKKLYDGLSKLYQASTSSPQDQ